MAFFWIRSHIIVLYTTYIYINTYFFSLYEWIYLNQNNTNSKHGSKEMDTIQQ